MTTRGAVNKRKCIISPMEEIVPAIVEETTSHLDQHGLETKKKKCALPLSFDADLLACLFVCFMVFCVCFLVGGVMMVVIGRHG